MYMGDIKLFTQKLETQIQPVRIYNQDIGIKFGIEKCAQADEKRQTTHDERNNTI